MILVAAALVAPIVVPRTTGSAEGEEGIAELAHDAESAVAAFWREWREGLRVVRDDRTIAGGADFLRAQDGFEHAELLTVRNPGAILRDESLVDVPTLIIRRTWMQRIRRLLGGET